MGCLARIALVAWLTSGCLDSPGSSAGDRDAEADANPAPGTTEWQIPLGVSLPYVALHDGEALVAAGFSGTIELDPPVAVAGGMTDVLLAGFTADGKLRFAEVYGGEADEVVTALSVSPVSGEVGVVGLYSNGGSNLGGDTFPAPSTLFNLFVARYDSGGAHDWSLAGTAAAGIGVGSALSMSGGGSLALSGDYSSDMAMDESSAPYSGSGYDLFFARISADGTAAQLVGYGGESDQNGAGALYDGLGKLYMFGTLTGPFFIDEFSPDPGSDGALFVCQIDDTGTDATWVIDSVGGRVGSLRGAVAPDGSLLLTGWFDGTFAFDLPDQVELTSRGGSDVFIAVIGPDQTVRWLEQFGGIGDDEPRGIAVGPDGEIAVTGAFRGEATLGETTLSSKGGTDVFLLSFGADRALRWASSFGDAEDDTGFSVAVDTGGAIVLGALYRGEVDFGGEDPLVTGGGSEGALVRFR